MVTNAEKKVRYSVFLNCLTIIEKTDNYKDVSFGAAYGTMWLSMYRAEYGPTWPKELTSLVKLSLIL